MDSKGSFEVHCFLKGKDVEAPCMFILFFFQGV
jgi:hypothetical protein